MRKMLLILAVLLTSAGYAVLSGESLKQGEKKSADSGELAAQKGQLAPSRSGRIPAKGYAVFAKNGDFQPYEFTRHAVGDHDILIEILYAGICHSDLHAVREDFGKSSFPMVPGHEIAGRVVKVGKNVTKFKAGDFAGVGCMVNSCGKCRYCEEDKEEFCEKGTVFTYNSIDRYHNNEITQGGYSDNIVVSERFAVTVPANADLKRVAPLLCAGITTYSPLKFSRVKKGDRVGVAGLGGLGHMALQYAVAIGAEVTVFDVADSKREDALRLGAARFVNVRNPENIAGLDNTFDFIISTVPANYDPMTYVKMLKMGGEMAIVGIPSNSTINIASLVFTPHRKVYGSLIGGIKETQEMLDYSVKNNIYPQVEFIAPSQITEAYKKLDKGEVRFRFVIDMSDR
jgi:uncharacterized zinc-type alcohol dehydrogenase-like protein